MITDDDLQALDGRDAVDRDGRVVGEVNEVYLDDRTGAPTWVAVATVLGSGAQFLPLHEASVEDGEVTFPYTRDQIARAPRLAPGEHLDVEQERRLYDHYGVEYDEEPQDADDLGAPAAPTGEESSDGALRARLPVTAAPRRTATTPRRPRSPPRSTRNASSSQSGCRCPARPGSSNGW